MRLLSLSLSKVRTPEILRTAKGGPLCWCRAAEAEKIPFVGDVEPLSALEEGALLLCTPRISATLPLPWADKAWVAAEYRQGSSVFVEKIRSLDGQYRSMRRTRGDGNCFFRSFMFAYMEGLVKTNNLPERNRLGA